MDKMGHVMTNHGSVTYVVTSVPLDVKVMGRICQGGDGHAGWLLASDVLGGIDIS